MVYFKKVLNRNYFLEYFLNVEKHINSKLFKCFIQIMSIALPIILISKVTDKIPLIVLCKCSHILKIIK